MNEEMSPSELLSAFLDGELPEPETNSLFYELAQNPELQTEMRQHIALHNSVQNIPLTIPAALKEGIFLKTGLAESVAEPVIIPVAGWTSVIMSIFKSRAFAVLIGGLMAVGAMFLYMRNVVENSPVITENNTKDIPAPQPVQTKIVEVPKIVTKIINADKDQIASAFKEGFKNGFAEGEKKSAANFSKENTAANGNNEQQPELPVENNNGRMSNIFPSETIGVTSNQIRQSAFEMPVSRFAIDNASSFGGPASDFSVQMRGTAALHSFVQVDVPSGIDPAFNNMSGSIQYRLNESNAVALEGGRETFLQRYSGVEDGKNFRYEQSYPAFWVGASYQYTFSKIERAYGLQPFSRLILGTTEVGPLLKPSIGVSYEYNNRIGFSTAIEYSLLRYTYQNQVFYTPKFGLTYGVLFRL